MVRLLSVKKRGVVIYCPKNCTGRRKHKRVPLSAGRLERSPNMRSGVI